MADSFHSPFDGARRYLWNMTTPEYIMLIGYCELVSVVVAARI